VLGRVQIVPHIVSDMLEVLVLVVKTYIFFVVVSIIWGGVLTTCFRSLGFG
jgi:hypothetical protein